MSSGIEQDIKPHLGKRTEDAVAPRHTNAMPRAIVTRDAPTIAHDVRRWVRPMFDDAIKRHLVRLHPAAAFDLADADRRRGTCAASAPRLASRWTTRCRPWRWRGCRR